MQLFHCSLECFSAVCVLGFPSHFSYHLVFPPSICLPLSHAEPLSVPRPVCVSEKLNSFQFSGHYFHDIWPSSQSVPPSFIFSPSLPLMWFFFLLYQQEGKLSWRRDSNTDKDSAPSRFWTFSVHADDAISKIFAFIGRLSTAFLLIFVWSPIMNQVHVSIQVH